MELNAEIHTTDAALSNTEALRGDNHSQSSEATALFLVRDELGHMRRDRDELGRKIGRLEGMIEYEERRLNKSAESVDKMISARESESLAQGLYEELGYAESSEDYLYIKGVVSKTRARVGQFLDRVRGNAGLDTHEENTLNEMLSEPVKVKRIKMPRSH